MHDDKAQPHEHDRTWISLDSASEIKFLSEELGVTEEEVKAAIEQVGSNPDAVKQHILGGKT